MRMGTASDHAGLQQAARTKLHGDGPCVLDDRDISNEFTYRIQQL